MSWSDVYREHWPPLVAWCGQTYGPRLDAENVAQAALSQVWRSDGEAVLGWPPALVRWHLIRQARHYVARRPGLFRAAATDPGLMRDVGGRREAGGVGDWLPDDLTADERRVAVMACDEGYSLAEVGAAFGRDKAWAMRTWRRAVYQVARTLGCGGRDFYRRKAALVATAGVSA